MRTLTITLEEDGTRTRVIGPIAYLGFEIEMDANTEEIRSDPALAAILAGAPLDVVMGLPGETVEWLDLGASVHLRLALDSSRQASGSWMLSERGVDDMPDDLKLDKPASRVSDPVKVCPWCATLFFGSVLACRHCTMASYDGDASSECMLRELGTEERDEFRAWLESQR
jgi:hypothetical protein